MEKILFFTMEPFNVYVRQSIHIVHKSMIPFRSITYICIFIIVHVLNFTPASVPGQRLLTDKNI